MMPTEVIFQRQNTVLKVSVIFGAILVLRVAASSINCTFEDKHSCNYTLNNWRRYMYLPNNPRKVKGHYVYGYNSSLRTPKVTIEQNSCLQAWCYFSVWQYVSFYYDSGSRDYRSYKKLPNTTWTHLQWNIKGSPSPLTITFKSYPKGSIDDITLVPGKCPAIGRWVELLHSSVYCVQTETDPSLTEYSWMTPTSSHQCKKQWYSAVTNSHSPSPLDCPTGMLPCPNQEYCIWKNQFCNRVNDCPGNLDESILMCQWDSPETTTRTLIGTISSNGKHDSYMADQGDTKPKNSTKIHSTTSSGQNVKGNSLQDEYATEEKYTKPETTTSAKTSSEGTDKDQNVSVIPPPEISSTTKGQNVSVIPPLEISSTTKGLNHHVTSTPTKAKKAVDPTNFLLIVIIATMGLLLLVLSIGMLMLCHSVKRLQRKLKLTKHESHTQLCRYTKRCPSKDNVYEPIKYGEDTRL